jgi:hypothetical protein
VQKSNHRRNEDIVGFIALFSKLLNRSSRIVCTRKIGNLSEQAGVPPVVGSGYGHTVVLGGGIREALDTHDLKIYPKATKEAMSCKSSASKAMTIREYIGPSSLFLLKDQF